MPTPIVIPQMGESVVEGTVGHWMKSEGDPIAKDETVVEIMTDKINVELPAGYHLNPNAPQRYSVSLTRANEGSTSPPLTLSKTGKGLALPIRVSVNWVTGVTSPHVDFVLHAAFTFVYCREDDTGVCRIKTLKWQGPIEVVNDKGASNEIRLSAKVAAE